MPTPAYIMCNHPNFTVQYASSMKSYCLLINNGFVLLGTWGIWLMHQKWNNFTVHDTDEHWVKTD